MDEVTDDSAIDRVEQVRVGRLRDTRQLGYVYDNLDWRHTLTPETTPQYPGGGKVVASLTMTKRERASARRLIQNPSAGRAAMRYNRVQLPFHPLCHRIFLLHPSRAEAGPATAACCGTFTIPRSPIGVTA
jgi:hypothetical protein